MWYAQDRFVDVCSKKSLQTIWISRFAEHHAQQPIPEEQDNADKKNASQVEIINDHRCKKIAECYSLQHAQDPYACFRVIGIDPVTKDEVAVFPPYKWKPIQKKPQPENDQSPCKYFFEEGRVASSLEPGHHKSHGITHRKKEKWKDEIGWSASMP